MERKTRIQLLIFTILISVAFQALMVGLAFKNLHGAVLYCFFFSIALLCGVIALIFDYDEKEKGVAKDEDSKA